MVKLGIMIEGQEGLNWERWNRFTDAAESLGFDSLWRSDHLASLTNIPTLPDAKGDPARETLALWPSLTAVALRTTRIEFGQLVSPATFRHPVHLASDGAAVDLLSNGRFWLGVGAGWNAQEHQAFGFPLRPVGERMDRFEEALQVIRLLGSGEPVSFQGTHFQLDEARTAYVPPRPSGSRLMLGGGGEQRTLRLVAEYADEWNAPTMPHAAYLHKTEVLHRHCDAVGRDPRQIQRSMLLGHIVGADLTDLRQRATNVQAILPGLRDFSADEVIERQRDLGWIVGTTDEVADQIQAWGALGVQRVMLQTFDMDDMDQMKLIASEVIPRVARG
jgi:F420-dependent oxidoreductase-like protein